jgi:hypothetical protein
MEAIATVPVDAERRAAFARDGYLVIDRLLPAATTAALGARFAPLFAGAFETGVFPDEWYWRAELSRPDVTRHMGNAWKSDSTVARVVLSAAIGELVSALSGWSGARLGLDTLWWKTPGAREIALHQDGTYMSTLDPPETTTCWIALDDTSAEAGTIAYVPGSHRWPLNPDIGAFHAPDGDWRSAMRAAAAAAGVADPPVVPVEVRAGGCVVHHGRTWHGSGHNRTADRMRRSLAIHLLPASARFRREGSGYIFGRYQRVGDTTMDESFFPILWTTDGRRSPFLDAPGGPAGAGQIDSA